MHPQKDTLDEWEKTVLLNSWLDASFFGMHDGLRVEKTRILGSRKNCLEKLCLRIIFYIYIQNFPIVGAIIKRIYENEYGPLRT